MSEQTQKGVPTSVIGAGRTPISRRLFLAGSVVTGAAFAMPAIAQARPRAKIGYWPIAGGLAFFSSIEKGYFSEAGVDVEAVRFAGPNQVVEALISGRIDGSATGTASTALALGDAQAPGSIKLFCQNYANADYVIDHIIVPKDSTATSIKDLAGKRFACGPGVNNVTLARAILENAGIPSPKVTELPGAQILPAMAAGQIDAAYVLEPTAVIGRNKGIAKILETAVVSRYVLGDAKTPWFGGAASLSSAFIEANPEAAKAVVTGYARGVDYVRQAGLDANQYLKGYTPIGEDLFRDVPVSGYRMASEMTPADWAAMQKLFDLFYERKVVPQKLSAATMAIGL